MQGKTCRGDQSLEIYKQACKLIDQGETLEYVFLWVENETKNGQNNERKTLQDSSRSNKRPKSYRKMPNHNDKRKMDGN